MRGRLTAFVVLLFLFSLSTASAQSVQPTSTPNPQLDAQARAIPNDDVKQLLQGVFRATALSSQIAYTQKPANEMPPDEPDWHYAGKGTDGKYHVWIHVDRSSLSRWPNFADWWTNPASSPFMMMLAADSGSAGPQWKARYDAAPNKLQFALVAERALQLMRDKMLAQDARELAVLRSLRIGSTRASVYAELKRHQMIAYNSMYNPGEATSNGGCRFDTTRAESYWPARNEPLPSNGCNAPLIQTNAPKSPSAFVDVGTDFGCGAEVQVRLDFTDADTLMKVDESHPQHSCP